MSYQIVTDSSCNLTEVLIDELELEILPLTFMVDGVQHQSYLKRRNHRPEAVLHHDARGKSNNHVTTESLKLRKTAHRYSQIRKRHSLPGFFQWSIRHLQFHRDVEPRSAHTFSRAHHRMH
mgnify:CR=1 FL=1